LSKLYQDINHKVGRIKDKVITFNIVIIFLPFKVKIDVIISTLLNSVKAKLASVNIKNFYYISIRK